jgi:hypothetical protein
MFDISLHILDLAENSIKAGADNLKISLEMSQRKNRLILRILDDGSGMTPEVVERVTSPFYTTRTERIIGLGISLMAQTCEETGGWLRIKSCLNIGTALEAVMTLDHIDRLPLGDLEQTIITLFLGSEAINIRVMVAKNEKRVSFSSKEIKQLLEIDRFSSPAAIEALRSLLKQEFAALGINHSVPAET